MKFNFQNSRSITTMAKRPSSRNDSARLLFRIRTLSIFVATVLIVVGLQFQIDVNRSLSAEYGELRGNGLNPSVVSSSSSSSSSTGTISASGSDTASSATTTTATTTTTTTSTGSRTAVAGGGGEMVNNNINEDDEEEDIPRRKWAYAFLMSDCDPNYRAYRGALYNILVAAKTLQESGTVADIVVMVQMASSAKRGKLPHGDVTALKAIGAKILYLDKLPVQNAYTMLMEKFQILNLIDYSRVMYLDGDVQPLCNLDYLFELSEPDEVQEKQKRILKQQKINNNNNNNSNKDNDNNDNAEDKEEKEEGENNRLKLKENIIQTIGNEPANGALFVMKPGDTEHDELLELIETRERSAQSLPSPYFDFDQGWGHVMSLPNDSWRGYSPSSSNNNNNETIVSSPGGTKWTWDRAMADQGLLYYWTKYIKKSVSIIIGDEIENWSSTVNSNNIETSYLEKVYTNKELRKYSCLPKNQELNGHWGSNKPIVVDHAPFRDFVQYTGELEKPWLTQAPVDVMFRENAHSSLQYWYHMLRKVQQTYNVPEKVNLEALEVPSPKPQNHANEENLIRGINTKVMRVRASST